MTIRRDKSAAAFAEAKEYLTGGVNSPARAYPKDFGPPPFIKDAKGAFIEDIDGNRYLDFVASWGPMLFGHNPAQIQDALTNQLEKGCSYGAPTELETRLAKLIASMVPSIEKMRFVNSGTEATMSALRLARGFTGRDLILKFEGCYHGHSDSLLVKPGSGAAGRTEPAGSGVPESIARLTLSAAYGNIEEVEDIFRRHGPEIAAVIIEPIAGNMGVIIPPQEFLLKLRSLTEKYETVLIFDEVMSGFRTARGGAQELFEITPDLTTLGKITGGGLPCGVFGGKKEIMQQLAPEGSVYQAGTLSGNPLAMRAGIEMLKLIDKTDPYPLLNKSRKRLKNVFEDSASSADIALQFHGCGGMFSFFFTSEKVTNFQTASTCCRKIFKKFHRTALEQLLYFPPSFYESSFISTCLSGKTLESSCRKIAEIFKRM